MQGISDINMADYDYDLPNERIAQYPKEKRDESLLLLYNKGDISKHCFKDIGEFIPTKSLLVFNNTKVIRARLLFKKDSGANIEIFCLEPLSPSNYEISFSSTGSVEWKCIAGNLKKWKSGLLTMTLSNDVVLTAEKISRENESIRVKFSWTPSNISFGEVLEMAGHIPLPPYIKREDTNEDVNRYQTVYSKIDGSVAAPTAGLHFTEKVFEDLNKRGIKRTDVTLHVGAGTFKPIKGDNVEEHDMHTEFYIVKKEVVKHLLDNKGNIIAVGTTSVRTIESIYWLGVKILKNPQLEDKDLFTDQWEPYRTDEEISMQDSFEAILRYLDDNDEQSIQASTKIIIVPGYRFRVIDGLITNFHQPRSSLLLLLAAWVGDEWKRIYDYALKNDFRFLSYGDSSLLLK
ncbi:MAG: S-adenosylmethionine:tRNA ribosyltransferase-isomerase [Bacteroidales bacterium]|nr:S-adenosylmethionine:tRNA ribosyltransferase-isomerase [Bacteroidales bacterium]